MKPSKLVELIELHDSSIEAIQYDRQKKECVLVVSLANWMQNDYTEGDVDSTLGHIIINNVSNLQIIPDLAFFTRDENISFDIIDSVVTPSEESGMEIWIITANVDDFSKIRNEFFSLSITANNARWKPLGR